MAVITIVSSTNNWLEGTQSSLWVRSERMERANFSYVATCCIPTSRGADNGSSARTWTQEAKQTNRFPSRFDHLAIAKPDLDILEFTSLLVYFWFCCKISRDEQFSKVELCIRQGAAQPAYTRFRPNSWACLIRLSSSNSLSPQCDYHWDELLPLDSMISIVRL